MRSFAAITVSILLLAGCAMNPVTDSGAKPDSTVESEPVARYLAWMDGDFQSGYTTDKRTADTRLQELEAKTPDPSNTESYLEYLSVLDASSHSADSEKKLKKYLSEHTDESRAVFLLAVHYLRLGKKEIAGYFFKQLEKNPNFPWKSLLLNDQGMMAMADKNRQEAINYFEKATKSLPKTPAPFVNLGALYLQSRSYLEAEKLFTVAMSIDPDMEDAALGLGYSLEGQAKFEEAHKVYGDFITSHPNALSALYNDSVILGNRLKRREEAAQQLLRYIQRGGKETAKAHEIIQSWR
jgi:tetratricopeptide (TPR) repeat protein